MDKAFEIESSIDKLEEGCDAMSLQPLFKKLIELKYELKVLDLLANLADKQWHTYELLEQSNILEIEKWILDSWDKTSYDETDVIISIVAHLGLTKVFEKMQNSELFSDIEIKNLIDDFRIEVGSDVSNPYSQMSS